MATKTIITYDGVKYQEVELEEIGNTGHYREVNRVTESVLGLLDDEQELLQAKTNINYFRNTNGTMFILTDSNITGFNAKYYYLYSTIAIHNPRDYDSLADGVIKTIESIGYVKEIIYNSKEITFILNDKQEEQELILYLRPISNDIKVIGV